jgi:hypothetical protein
MQIYADLTSKQSIRIMAESAGEFEMGCMEIRESCLALAD